MLNFFKQKKKNDLPYDAKLIKKFHKDHKKLVATAIKISKKIEAEEHDKIKPLLKQLKLEILGHFMEEDIKLYRYLKKYYANSEESMALINTFEESIKAIQKDVISFLDNYTQENSTLDTNFKKRFHTIVNDLGNRIETEENSLYTLYIP